MAKNIVPAEITKQQGKIIDAADDIAQTSAIEAKAVAFTSPLFILATLPHREPLNKDTGEKLMIYTRTVDDYELVVAGGEHGVPFGIWPRLIFIFLITEAVRTGNRVINLGYSLREFLRKLGVEGVSGGKTGNIRHVHDQVVRMSECRISCKGYKPGKKRDSSSVRSIKNIMPVGESLLWWDIKKDRNPNQASLFESTITLTEDFFNFIVQHPIPLDWRALIALKGSSMALDIYSWLVYSIYAVYKSGKSTKVSWKRLYKQFGANYKRLRDFKKSFLEQLNSVLKVYPEAKISFPDEESLELLVPSSLHVAELPK